MTRAFRILSDMDLSGKRVLVRLDLNVPMDDGKVGDATRIARVLPTLRAICEAGGKAIILAHFGRPKGRDAAQSLRPVAAALGDHFGAEVAFADDCIGDVAAKAIAALGAGDVLCLENTRFHAGEEANDPAFVGALAALGDVYVNDAFSAAHRAHASTEGLAHRLPSCAGLSMQAELEALSAGLDAPARPVMAIVGGAKVSTKLELLGNLVRKVDCLVIGGGMANTFLAARGTGVGKSLCEHHLAQTARAIEAKAEAAGCEILLPVDGVVSRAFAAHSPHRVSQLDDVGEDEMILDAGPASVARVVGRLAHMRTVVWNGPFGAFELPPFDTATLMVARVVAERTRAGHLVSVAGGGDTVAAMNHAGVAGGLSYLSTAGGAFLEWMEGKELPGVAALTAAAAQPRETGGTVLHGH